MTNSSDNAQNLLSKKLKKGSKNIIKVFASSKGKTPPNSNNPTPPTSPPKTSESKDRDEFENLNYPFFLPWSEVILLKSYEDKNEFLRKGALLVTIESGLFLKKGVGNDSEEWTEVERTDIEASLSYYIRSNDLKETDKSIKRKEEFYKKLEEQSEKADPINNSLVIGLLDQFLKDQNE